MPMKDAENHVAEHRRADMAPRQLPGAARDHQRQETEDEGETTTSAQPRTFRCGFEQFDALFPLLLLDKLDD